MTAKGTNAIKKKYKRLKLKYLYTKNVQYIPPGIYKALKKNLPILMNNSGVNKNRKFNRIATNKFVHGKHNHHVS